MTDKTALGDRMKQYEQPWKLTFPRRQPVVIRVDGRSFHQYLRGADTEAGTAQSAQEER